MVAKLAVFTNGTTYIQVFGKSEFCRLHVYIKNSQIHVSNAMCDHRYAGKQSFTLIEPDSITKAMDYINNRLVFWYRLERAFADE